MSNLFLIILCIIVVLFGCYCLYIVFDTINKGETYEHPETVYLIPTALMAMFGGGIALVMFLSTY